MQTELAELGEGLSEFYRELGKKEIGPLHSISNQYHDPHLMELCRAVGVCALNGLLKNVQYDYAIGAYSQVMWHLTFHLDSALFASEQRYLTHKQLAEIQSTAEQYLLSLAENWQEIGQEPPDTRGRAWSIYAHGDSGKAKEIFGIVIALLRSHPADCCALVRQANVIQLRCTPYELEKLKTTLRFFAKCIGDLSCSD